MSYYFRIHKGADDQAPETGWNETGIIKDNNTGIQSIDDTIDQIPASGKVGTSIPTPLARIYLFNTAFEALKDGGIKNKTYEQLVSDCLDLLQFLFEKGNDPEFKFYDLNIAATIKRLKDSNNHGDQILADSLELSIGQNSLFSTSLFIIEYKGIVLGGTSPFTMVYTSPNLRREISLKGLATEFSSNQKQEFFSHKICPIDQRPKEFKAYLQQLYNYVTGSGAVAGADKQPFFMYLIKKLGMVDKISNYDELYPAVKTQTGASVSTLYANISYNDAPVVMDNSDFLIKPTVSCNRPPLVLPSNFVPSQSQSWIYTDSPWNENTRILDADCNTSVEKRKLPKNGLDSSHESSIQYPWLSNCDFFNDNLIDLGYVINTDKFLYPACNYDITFLLPIKKLYFDYFTIDDLKKYLTISRANARVDENKRTTYEEVSFSLIIPLKSAKGQIVLERTYRKNSPEYGIVSMPNPIGMGIFPFYKIINGADAVRNGSMGNDYYCNVKNEYSIYLFCKPSSDSTVRKPSLKFYNCEKKREVLSPSRERTRNAAGASIIYSIRPDQARSGDDGLTTFDYIELNDLTQGMDKAILVPLFVSKESHSNSDKQAVFAIDFGTSNTHVSYWDYESSKPRPLEITPDMQQMVLLNKPILDKNNILQYRSKGALRRASDMDDFLREFVPPIIGNERLNKGVSYPIKTATLQGKKPLGDAELFGNVNIGFDVDNEEVALTDDFIYKTNLKWALQESRSNSNDNNDDHRVRVHLFCEETLWLLKNLLVLKEMSNSGITLRYFYPESMMQEDKDMFDEEWRSTCKDVFRRSGFEYSDSDIKSMSESVAPYYSLLRRNGDLLNYNSVNIDIGGGTTDIFFFDRGMDHGMIAKGFDSSIYFAANDIWGQTYPSVDNPKNGFVQFMKDRIPSLEGKRNDLVTLYNNFSGQNDPASLSGFFFKHEGFKFGDNIKNVKPFKFLLFLHYASLIYYVTDMIKCIREKGLSQFNFPKVMTFTGKGSEYLKLITPNPEHITRLTQALFESFGIPKEQLPRFQVQYPENPKTLTADGGVYSCKETEVKTEFVLKDEYSYDDAVDPAKKCEYQQIGKYLLGFDNVSGSDITIKELRNNEPEYKGLIKNKFRTFIDCLFDNEKLVGIARTIGVEFIPAYRDAIIQSAEESLNNHFIRFVKERGNNENMVLDVTLFFLTLKNSIIDLSYKFYEGMSNGNN